MTLWFFFGPVRVCACASVCARVEVYSQTRAASIRWAKMLVRNVYAADKSELPCVHRQAQAFVCVRACTCKTKFGAFSRGHSAVK